MENSGISSTVVLPCFLPSGKEGFPPVFIVIVVSELRWTQS